MNQQDDPLDRRIKQFYKKQELPTDVLNELKFIAQATPSAPPPPTLMSRVSTYGAYAAVALLLFTISLFGMSRYTRAQTLETVAAEIALNHVKRFETEVTSPNIANLSTAMPLLDFLPTDPQQMQYDRYTLIGARYCTIDSAIAVQIHLEDENRHPYTLYQFKDPAVPLGEKEEVVEIDDIEVTLWKEGDVIMGLAHRVTP